MQFMMASHDVFAVFGVTCLTGRLAQTREPIIDGILQARTAKIYRPHVFADTAKIRRLGSCGI
jgi:hypothetical protein